MFVAVKTLSIVLSLYVIYYEVCPSSVAIAGAKIVLIFHRFAVHIM